MERLSTGKEIFCSPKKHFVESLSGLLKPHDFVYDKPRERFIKKESGRTSAFLLVFKEKYQLIGVQPSVCIRFEEVEALFHQTSGFEPKYHLGTCTVGSSIAELQGKSQIDGQFRFGTANEAEFAAEETYQLFLDSAQPYFERWKSLQAIDIAINDRPRERIAEVKRGPAWFRCSTGLITAKLVDRPNYDELVDVYMEVMTHNNKGFYLGRFKALVASLQDFKPTQKS